MNIHYSENQTLNAENVKALYEDDQWTLYTKDMPRLMQAIDQSLSVITAWDRDRLVGLIRVVGDGLTIIYIQDIIVLREYQKEGIGSELMKQILAKYSDVRQKVLLTDDAPDVRQFYEKNNFRSCDQGELVAFVQLNNH